MAKENIIKHYWNVSKIGSIRSNIRNEGRGFQNNEALNTLS